MTGLSINLLQFAHDVILDHWWWNSNAVHRMIVFQAKERISRWRRHQSCPSPDPTQREPTTDISQSPSIPKSKPKFKTYNQNSRNKNSIAQARTQQLASLLAFMPLEWSVESGQPTLANPHEQKSTHQSNLKQPYACFEISIQTNLGKSELRARRSPAEKTGIGICFQVGHAGAEQVHTRQRRIARAGISSTQL